MRSVRITGHVTFYTPLTDGSACKEFDITIRSLTSHYGRFDFVKIIRY